MKSNIFNTLGHERRHKYLSIHMPKSPPKHPLVLLLSSKTTSKNTPVPGYVLAGTRFLFLGFLLYICCILTCHDVFRVPCKFNTSFGSIIGPNEVAKGRLDLFLYLRNRFDIASLLYCTFGLP